MGCVIDDQADIPAIDVGVKLDRLGLLVLPALYPLHDPGMRTEVVPEEGAEDPCQHGLRVGEGGMRSALGLDVAEVVHDLSLIHI